MLLIYPSIKLCTCMIVITYARVRIKTKKKKKKSICEHKFNNFFPIIHHKVVSNIYVWAYVCMCVGGELWYFVKYMAYCDIFLNINGTSEYRLHQLYFCWGMANQFSTPNYRQSTNHHIVSYVSKSSVLGL